MHGTVPQSYRLYHQIDLDLPATDCIIFTVFSYYFVTLFVKCTMMDIPLWDDLPLIGGTSSADGPEGEREKRIHRLFTLEGKQAVDALAYQCGIIRHAKILS